MQNPLLPCIHRTHSSVLSFNRTFFFCSFSNQSVLLCDSCFPKCPSLKKKKKKDYQHLLFCTIKMPFITSSLLPETQSKKHQQTNPLGLFFLYNDGLKMMIRNLHHGQGFFFYELFVSNTCLTCPQCLPVCKKEDKLSQISAAILSQNLLSSDRVVELQSSGLTHIPIHPNVRKVHLSKQTLELTPVSLELPRMTFLGKICVISCVIWSSLWPMSFLISWGGGIHDQHHSPTSGGHPDVLASHMWSSHIICLHIQAVFF